MTETDQTTEKSAKELTADLAEAPREEVQAILDAEQARPEPRKTVVKAAEDRLAELADPLPEGAEVLDAAPDGPWAHLVGDDGEPVLVDGKPVSVPLVP